MRIHLLGLSLLMVLAVPAAAQRDEPVERRIQRLEQEMRAVQRRVFPGGRQQFVEPEIEPIPGTAPQPVASGDALSSLASRVDPPEAQLRTLTGQIEEQEHRGRQLEEQMSQLRTELQGRLDRIEQQGRQPPPAAAEPEPRAEPESPAAEPEGEPAAEPA